jgi:hypothetical protein
VETPLKPLLIRDLDDWLNVGNMYQVQRYLIAEKDDVKMEKLLSQILAHIENRLLQGVR